MPALTLLLGEKHPPMEVLGKVLIPQIECHLCPGSGSDAIEVIFKNNYFGKIVMDRLIKVIDIYLALNLLFLL